jgi:hypothetical protein
MAQISYPFVSIDGDRKITASEEAAGFAVVGASGVALGYMGELAVDAVTGALAVSVASGGAIVEGRRYVQDDAEQVDIAGGDAQPRIDVVALEANMNTPVRAVRLVVVKGTAASNPAPPALTQTASVYQIPLARVLVPANATTLNAATVTDARVYVKGRHMHSVAEIDGVQAVLDGKQDKVTGGATTILSANLAASRALASDGSGKVVTSAATSAELGHLSGVTSGVQAQLNAKAAAAHTHAIGDVSGLQSALNGKQATLASDQRRKITISTSAPSGGADGDVWLQY